MQQTTPRTYAHGIQHTRPIRATGGHIGDAANEPFDLDAYLQARREERARLDAKAQAAAEEYRKWDAARWAANPRPWEREEGYGRLKCSLCLAWADSQVCKRCSAGLERSKGLL